MPVLFSMALPGFILTSFISAVYWEQHLPVLGPWTLGEHQPAGTMAVSTLTAKQYGLPHVNASGHVDTLTVFCWTTMTLQLNAN